MAAVVNTFPQLEEWGERAKSPFIPASGSALAQDEAVYRWLSTSEVAWQALCAAQDHLKGCRTWVEAGELFPMATFSLLRGALVGGTMAAWVLSSDQLDTRLGRSLCVAADWYKHHRAFAADTPKEPVQGQTREELLRHLDKRLAQVTNLRQGKEPKGKLLMGAVVKQANNEVWPNDSLRAAETMDIWRAGSGDAHGLGWSLLTRSYDMTPLAGGIGQFVGSPSSHDFANAYLCAYDFVAYGYHRLDELGTVQPSPS